ncbi:phospholipase D-like domain-containing protein [Clostridium tyrobutyricum]|uniref:phospholipase D-like domain-containing protein n=1 Tax=Clostridium tyrobutyricum TaxID=1519 RepID=UPI0011CA6836|nr:phospholipase D-like domain-containing protein [Clostridium tyrobutyricum]
METDKKYSEILNRAKSINEIFITLINMRRLNIQISYYIKQLLNYIKDGALRNELLQMEVLNKRSIEKRYKIRFLTEIEQLEIVNKGSIFGVYIENPSRYMKALIAKDYNKQILYSDKSLICEAKEIRAKEIRAKELKGEKIEEKKIKAYIKEPWIINYSEEIDENLLNKIILMDSSIIKFIRQPSENIKRLSVKQNGLNIKFLNEPSVEIQLIAVKQNGCSIQYINNPSIKVQLEAVKRDSMAIKYIQKPTIEVLMESVKNDPFSIQYIYDIPLEIQLQAVKLDGDSIKYIENFFIEVAIEAVRTSENAIRYIKKPSLEIQIESVKNHPESIKLIRKPYKKVVKLYNKIKNSREKYPLEKDINNVVKEEKYKFSPVYESDFENLNSETYNSYILDWRDDLSKHINYLCKKIKAIEFDIATGFAMKSGFKLINESIKYILNNKGTIKLIIGSLQNYNEIINRTTGKVLGMDSATAEFINELIDKGVIVKTFVECFYHGKFYLLKGENCYCVIVGSSNLSMSGLKKNRELDILYIFHKENEKVKEFLEFFGPFWDECSKIDKLKLEYFNVTENEIHINDNLMINKIEKNYIKNKIKILTDEEIKRRLKIWLSKNPDNIYSNLGVLNLKDYILFEFKENNLLVLESFDAGNSYYYFYNYDINSLLTEIQSLTRTEIFNLSGMPKRGYHIKNNYRLGFDINNLFIK